MVSSTHVMVGPIMGAVVFCWLANSLYLRWGGLLLPPHAPLVWYLGGFLDSGYYRTRVALGVLGGSNRPPFREVSVAVVAVVKRVVCSMISVAFLGGEKKPISNYRIFTGSADHNFGSQSVPYTP